MRFKEYCGCFDKQKEFVFRINDSAIGYLRRIAREQTVSIGRPSVVVFDERKMMVECSDDSFDIRSKAYKSGVSICLEVLVSDRKFVIDINPLYFREDNICNYLRECELYIRKRFSDLRRKIYSSSV